MEWHNGMEKQFNDSVGRLIARKVDDKMVNTMIYVFFFILIAWFIFKQFAPIKGLKNLSAAEFENEIKQYGNSIQLIDVRELHEFRQNRIVAALNIPLSQFKQKLCDISKDKAVYLYCHSGMRGKQAGRILKNNGYTQVNHLNGGMMVGKARSQHSCGVSDS